MRTNFHPIILFVLAACCGCSSVNYPEIHEKLYEPLTDSLYHACADLRGLGRYEIGRTTLKDIKKDKDYLRNNPYEITRDYNNLYNGHWGSRYFHSSDIEKFSWMEKQSRNEIRQITPQLLGYSIGDIEFDNLDMAFLNDTLVAVFFKPGSKFKDDVLEHYKEKYGNGRGTYYRYHRDNEPCRDRDLLYSETTVEEHLVWENERVALQYDNDEHFKMGPDIKTEYNGDMSYLVYSKDRYPVFEEKLKALSDAYDRMKGEEKSSTLNSL